MKLKHLREFLDKHKDLPDNTPVLKPGYDHSFTSPSNIELGSVLYSPDCDMYSEYYNDQSTPEINGDKKIEAVIFWSW